MNVNQNLRVPTTHNDEGHSAEAFLHPSPRHPPCTWSELNSLALSYGAKVASSDVQGPVLGFSLAEAFEVYLGRKKENPMSKKHTLTKRHRRPKSGKRIDPTARTMAAVKELELAANLKAK